MKKLLLSLISANLLINYSNANIADSKFTKFVEETHSFKEMDKNDPNIIKYILNQGAKLLPVKPMDNMTSYFMYTPKMDAVRPIYLTPDNKVMILGEAYMSNDPDHVVNMTNLQAAALWHDLQVKRNKMMEKDPSLAKKFAKEEQPSSAVSTTSTVSIANSPEEWKSLSEHSHWFNLGKVGAPIIWMVIDVHCPYCEHAFEQLKPAILNGKLDLHIIPIVGLPGSEQDSINLVSSNDPGVAYLNHNFSVPSKDPTKAIEKLKFNNNLALKLGINHTPILIYNNGTQKIEGDDLSQLTTNPPH